MDTAPLSYGATRRVAHISPGLPTSDGAGVNLTRMLGHTGLPDLDPFLMLDQIRADNSDDYLAGFPDHPHRGFETVTIMIEGAMRHGDNKGHAGVIEAGGLQWMTAGRGIVHSEKPTQTEGRLWGFQLWINLPAASKMIEPRYQEFVASQIPSDVFEGGAARVLAGTTSRGVAGPAKSAATDPLLLDVHLNPGAVFTEAVEVDHNAVVAVYAGDVAIGPEDDARRIDDPNLAVLSLGEFLRLKAGENGARALVMSGRPLREPVARYGPFVMNTQAEIRQAFADFQSGRF